MKGKELPLTILILGLGGLLIYIRSQLGDVAALCFLFFLLGFITAVIAIALGGRLNDQGQHAFIQGLAQLKGVMAPVVREQARTAGYQEREQIKLDYRQAAAQPSPEEQAVEDWYRQYEHYR